MTEEDAAQSPPRGRLIRGGPPEGQACGGENGVCRRGEHQRAKAMEDSIADRLAKSSKDRDGLGPTAIRR